jgi:hypothetical protein
MASPRTGEAGPVRRAPTALLAAGVSIPVVREWRYHSGDRYCWRISPSGQPKTVDEVKVVVTTPEPPVFFSIITRQAIRRGQSPIGQGTDAKIRGSTTRPMRGPSLPISKWLYNRWGGSSRT